jgi:hypothetical protein
MAEVEEQLAEEQAPAEQSTEHEAKARDWGWKPKEEYKGDPDTWVDASEFVETRNPYTIIQKQNREMETLKKTLNATANHVKKVGELAYKRAINDLQKDRKKAVERADVDEVGAIDEEIAGLKQEADSVPHEFTEWVGENAWFGKDQELYTFACASFDAQVKRNPSMPLNEVLDMVTKATKRAYPESFEQQKAEKVRPSAPSVEGGTRPSNVKSGPGYNSLSPDQKRVCDTFVRGGIMTKEDYVKSLVEIGEL